MDNFDRDKTSHLKKIWHFIWYDDSVWSWLIAIVLAFIVVKFIFFPLLSFVLGTKLPLVVVESGSMSHPQDGFFPNLFSTEKAFNKWWEQNAAWYVSREISVKNSSAWPFRTGMEPGDIIVAVRAKSVNLGDVIIFNANQKHPIIHRVIGIINNEENEIAYSTKGDNNADQLQSEKNIPNKELIGKALFRIPKIGWLKLGVVKVFSFGDDLIKYKKAVIIRQISEAY